MRKEQRSPVVRAEKAFELRHAISHPWNPGMAVPGTPLDKLTGLTQCRVRVVKLSPGSIASLYHTQRCEDEWIYMLQGQGTIEIEGVEYPLGPGDFVGLPAPTQINQLRNDSDKSLLCLMGGSRSEVDMVEFPREGKRLLRHGESMEIYDLSDAEEVAPANLDELLGRSGKHAKRKS